MRHQFGHGLSMQAAYTWDKNLSDVFFGNSANINDALALKTAFTMGHTRAWGRYRSIASSGWW